MPVHPLCSYPMLKKVNRPTLCSALLFAAAAGVHLPAAQAQPTYIDDYTGGGGDSSWSDNNNWTVAVPGSGAVTNIISPGSTVFNVNYDYTGAAAYLNTLAIDQTGGLVNTLTMSANNLFSGPEYIGYAGGGAFNQSGGTNTMTTAGFLLLGNGTLSVGTYTLSGSGNVVAEGDGEYVGGFGSGYFNQSGGTNTIGTGGYLYVGSAGSAAGIYTLTGGSANVGGGIYVGGNNNNRLGGTGQFTLSSSGSLTTAGGEYVGYNGVGIFNQSGGVNTLSSGSSLSLGNAMGAAGVYSLSGGTLSVGGAAYVGGWFLGPEGTGTLNVSGTGTLSVAGTLTAYNTAGSGVNVSGGSASAAAFNLLGAYKQTGGTATFGQITGSGSATITGGKTTLAANRILSQVDGLSISSPGKLDLTNNSLAINYGSPASDPKSAIAAALASGYNGGKWTGNGLTSSSAAANAGVYSVGYADGDTDTGTAAGANQILVAYTLAGDATLTGSVGFDDLIIVSQNYGLTGKDWSEGNFTYDPSGSVGFADLVIVAQDYGQSTTVAEVGGAALSVMPLAGALEPTAVVPEPAAGAMLVVAALVAARRRRGRTQRIS